jgi:hypothetical protein
MEKNNKNIEKGETQYMKLRNQYEELRVKLDWLNNDSFLLESKADMKQVYMYLKNKPESAKFIYKKYPDLRETIKEICDPDNPLFLSKVKDSLSELIDFDIEKVSLEDIRNEVKKQSIDLDRLKAEIKDEEKQYDQIALEIDRKKAELENLDRLSGNIRSDPGLERINDYITDAKAIMETIEKKGDEYFIAHITHPEAQITMSKDQFLHVKSLINNADELKKYLESNDFLSSEYLDENRKKIKEQMEKEKQSALNEVESIKLLNPLRSIKQLNSGIANIRYKLDKGEEVGGIVTFNIPGFKMIKGELEELMTIADNMEMQFTNVKERGKKQFLKKVE